MLWNGLVIFEREDTKTFHNTAPPTPHRGTTRTQMGRVDIHLPRKIDIKQLYMYFCHGRKIKNKLKCISAMEERQKNNDGDGKYRQHSTPNGLGTST